MVQSLTGPDWWKVLTVLVLMFVNWGIETRKWQLLIYDVERISFLKAFRAVFSGQAFAINTVNNVGEYVGRVMYLHEGNRLRAVSLTIVGSMAQIITTFAIGLIGLLFMKNTILGSSGNFKGFSVFWIDGMMWLLLLITIVLLLFYYSLSWVTKIVERLPFMSRFVYLIEKLEQLHWKELTRILILSVIRYVVFVVQYLLLLQVFKVEADAWSVCWMVCVMFLILAIVPSIALAELGLRGEVSIQLLGLLSGNTLGIVFSATGIWMINRVMPAVAGSLFILGVRLFKK